MNMSELGTAWAGDGMDRNPGAGFPDLPVAALDFAQVANRCSMPIAVTDSAGGIEWVNTAFEIACGEDAAALRGRPLGQVQRLARRVGRTDEMWAELDRRGQWSGEVRLQHHYGSRLRTSVEIRALGHRDAPAGSRRFICTYGKGEAIRPVAVSGQDPLTGVLDRAALIAAANIRCARGIALIVLTVDITGFTMLNQEVGWSECDRLLQSVAHRCSRLADSVLAPALVGRTGADEFAIVFEVDDEPSRTIADARIRALQCGLDAPFDAAQGPLQLDFTFGRCELPLEAEDAQAALVHATAARREGPVAGDNVSHYAQYRSECSLLLELRRAVSGHRMQIAWQPQVDLPSGRVTSAEALVRWIREDGTEVPPARFLPAADRDGLITRIDDQVMELALRDFAGWRAEGTPVARISVNVSSAQFQRPGMAQRVADALDRHGLHAGCLDIEITESVLLNHVPTIIDTLRELHALGVTLSIDDFGTGYSSLSYLRELPIDRIKIDRSFVADIAEHATSREIVRSVVDLAERIGLRVIAEGIETEGQMRMLGSMGCLEGQGFLVGKPMAADDFTRWACAR
jgi:EAL domain-containing protein (putative c-di-GMP-specific phosphodiesterase class I)/GGDEF domain-containing protein